MKQYNALLQVKADPDGRLRLLYLKVDDHDGSDDTVADGVYTIQLARVGVYATQAEAADHWNYDLRRWYLPLLINLPDRGRAVAYGRVDR